MLYRWWQEWTEERESLAKKIQTDHGEGTIYKGKNTFISSDAKLNGNIWVGDNCMIGNGVIIRGNAIIHNNVRIGYGVEVKDSIIKENSTIGPLCYVGDSLLEQGVYLGALVRTSNHRLDREIIKSWNGEYFEETGFVKLGSHIKRNTSLGIGVVILPGRIVPENSIFEPLTVITRNYDTGHYRSEQNIIRVEGM